MQTRPNEIILRIPDPPCQLVDGYLVDEYAIMLYRYTKRCLEYLDNPDLTEVRDRLRPLCFPEVSLTHWTYRRWLWILKTANLVDCYEEVIEQIIPLLDRDLLEIIMYSPDPTDWLGLVPLSPIPSLRILWQHVICISWLEHGDARFLLPPDQLEDLFATDLDSLALLLYK